MTLTTKFGAVLATLALVAGCKPPVEQTQQPQNTQTAFGGSGAYHEANQTQQSTGDEGRGGEGGSATFDAERTFGPKQGNQTASDGGLGGKGGNATISQEWVEPTDPAEFTPAAESLRGYWLSYSQVANTKDLDDNRHLDATDGSRIYSVAVYAGKEFAAMPFAEHDQEQRRNKVILDFMAACIGEENTLKLTQMSEGQIMVYTTEFPLSKTVEVTYKDAVSETFVRDAAFDCKDKEGNLRKANAATARVLAYNGKQP